MPRFERVPESARIGAPGSGFASFERGMYDAIVLVAAQAMGGAERALEITVEYAKVREQFDKPLAAFQAISHYLADGATAVDGGKTLVYEAAWARSAGRGGVRWGPVAFWLTEHFCPGQLPGLRRWFYDTNAPDVAMGLSVTLR